MLCSNCNNLLEKRTSNNGVKFHCASCGSVFDADIEATLIYNTDKEIKYNLTKTGKSIFAYPSNPKVQMKCPKCPAQILGYEVDNQMRKTYGCGDCNHTFT